MNAPGLTFNIITFDHPSSDYTFYFSDKKNGNQHRIPSNIAADEVITEFGTQDHYYTSFSREIGNLFPVKKKTSDWNDSFLKMYYNSLIHDYFKNQEQLLAPDFSRETEIWFKCRKYSDPDFVDYMTFKLKVQFDPDRNPEILIKCQGVSKVFKQSMTQLGCKIRPDRIIRVVYNGNLFPYDLLGDSARRKRHKVFPVLNDIIEADLNSKPETQKSRDLLRNYHKLITVLFTKYLNVPEFKRVIPINCDSFKKVACHQVNHVPREKNRLIFGGKKHGFNPLTGINDFGPYDISPHTRILFFFIVHEKDCYAVEKLNKYLKGEEPGFGGLYDHTKTPYYALPQFRIVFKNKENPLPEIEEQLSYREFDHDIHYVALFLGSSGTCKMNPSCCAICSKINELLLKHHVIPQVIDIRKLDSPNYQDALENISITILAKLDGIPWLVDPLLKNELVIGVGVFKDQQTQVQSISGTYCFKNDGKIRDLGCLRKDQLIELAGAIIWVYKEYKMVNNSIKRLVVHLYKNMNHKELAPIEEMLHNLGLNIPVYILRINKPGLDDVIVFDETREDMAPESGTCIHVGYCKYLLYNKHFVMPINESVESPFPIEISISCSQPECDNDSKTVHELINQIYQFCRLNWKLEQQSVLPVTIKYAEIVAGIYPQLEGKEVPAYGRDTPWFL